MGERFPAIILNCLQGQTCSVRPREQIFRYPKISIIFWTALCPTPSCTAVYLTVILRSCLMSSSTFCLLRSVNSRSRSNTARLIGDVRVSVLKMFHPPSDTAGTHAGISIHTTKSLIWDCCRVSFFHKKPNDMLTEWHVSNSHFLALHDGDVRDAHAFLLEREDAANGPTSQRKHLENFSAFV
jgi:hypothetical protein